MRKKVRGQLYPFILFKNNVMYSIIRYRVGDLRSNEKKIFYNNTGAERAEIHTAFIRSSHVNY